MKTWEADADAASDTEKGAAGKEPVAEAEKPFFVSPFRERVLYAWYMVQILGFSVVTVTLLILQYNEEREKCRCRV